MVLQVYAECLSLSFCYCYIKCAQFFVYQYTSNLLKMQLLIIIFKVLDIWKKEDIKALVLAMTIFEQ